ncbi:MAG: saccharopine dehydrogenase family protein [Acidimicrobiales bacterium]
MTWMVYGAYGYTGRLVTALATERGEMPVLAGRDEKRLAELAALFQLEHRAVGLDDPAALARALQGVDVVAHCAGPFSATAQPMVDACIATGTHYLDITGEIDVFEHVLARNDEAVAAGVALIPGSGFDVVPSDCLAALLARQLPGATALALAIRFDGTPSPGTAKTAMESLGTVGRSRVDGVIGEVPAARRRRRIPFPDGERDTVAIAWGDVSTAFHSTGIGNVTVYAALPPVVGAMAAMAPAMGPLLRHPAVQRTLKRVVGRLPGPSAKVRSETKTVVWGEVTGAGGETVSGWVVTLNGYDLTADSVVRIAGALERGEVAAGAHTPSKALGADFVRQLDKIEVRVPA